MNILSILALFLVGLMMMEAALLNIFSATNSLVHVEMCYRDARLSLPIMNTAFRYATAAVIWALFAAYMEAMGLKDVFIFLNFAIMFWCLGIGAAKVPQQWRLFYAVMLSSTLTLGFAVVVL